MRQRERSLDLIVPGLLGPVPESVAQSPAAGARFAALERLLSRGSRSLRPVFDPASLLAGCVVDPPERASPGPVGLLGAGGDPGDRYWYRVDPVHLRPDRDRLMVFGPAAVGLDPEEAEAVADACNRLLRDDGMELVASADHWYLATPAEPDVVMAGIHRVSGHYMDAYLPAGPDARKWNALLSELQMLLHGLALNQKREAAGLPTVNGVWPWGGGFAPPALPAPYGAVYADDDLGRGMARQGGLSARPVPVRASELRVEGRALLHDPRALDALTSGDAGTWLEVVTAMENDRFSDLLHDLRRGALQRLRIMPGCGRQWTVTRNSLRRVWRPTRSFRYWLRGASGGGEQA